MRSGDPIHLTITLSSETAPFVYDKIFKRTIQALSFRHPPLTASLFRPTFITGYMIPGLVQPYPSH